jgi:hypothetical protein
MVRYVESIAIQRRLFVTNRVWISPVVDLRMAGENGQAKNGEEAGDGGLHAGRP